MSRRKQKTASEYNQEHLRRAQKRMLSITPPEGVPIAFMRASLMSRIGAQFLDLLVTYGLLIVVLLSAIYLISFSWDTFSALFALLAFLLRVPYYILTELVWNGRTIGKRASKIRVISINGRRLDPHQVVVRNLLKEAEVFLPIMLIFGLMDSTGWVQFGMAIWLLIVLAVPIFSKQSQRLGDMIAGTCVVRMPRVQRSSELTDQAKPVADMFVFLPHHLEQYGRFELQSLEGILRDTASSRHAYERDVEVAKTIRRKIGFTDKIDDARSRDFLSSFYNAQRAFLEAGQIFGDVRDDKMHREDREKARQAGRR